MKKLICMMLAVLLVFSMILAVSASDAVILTAKDVDEFTKGTSVKDGLIEGKEFTRSYFGFYDVDMTGVKSIELKLKMNVQVNGEFFRIKVDDPYSLNIGYVVVNKKGENGVVTARGNITPVEGKHKLYIGSTMTATKLYWGIESVTLYKEAAPVVVPVPDSKIVDNYSDTWVAVDSMGRKVADFEEAGPVKEGTRKVGMFYWTQAGGGTNGIIPEIIRSAPEARYSAEHEAWGKDGAYWWGQPALGFYGSAEYWVYRKHAVMLANAGVDAIFMDFTNDSNAMIHNFSRLYDAFHDARESGVNAPKLSIYGNMAGASNAQPNDMLPSMYYSFYADEEYSDLWFIWKGQPFMINFPVRESVYANDEDKDVLDMYKTISETFDLANPGELRSGTNDLTLRHVNWLEEYPQHPFSMTKSGRFEFMNLAMAINQSYVVGHGVVGVFSDPYTKGKGYSEAFGEDLSATSGKVPYFFREQAAHVLSVDPEFVFVDGWNEWRTPKYESYGANKCAFVDLFDEENSRDFEPSRSYLKDDYYNLLVDFVRKYKGVRPAPVASEKVTIDINGDIAQWNNVGPLFINDYDAFERDSIGSTDRITGEAIRYKTTVNNSIASAKVARDDENFYFLVTARDVVKTGHEGFMNLYINSDRNYATGWEGYDYSVNVAGNGIIAKATSNAWAWENIGNVTALANGNTYQIVIPRALIGETGTADFEFKWTDSISCDGDYLDFYSEGSSAPMGKFNYLYTEIQQTALKAAEREAINDVSIVKIGSSRMIIDGGKVSVYEPDTRITAIEMNGTAYVPMETFEDVLGNGLSKITYNAEKNIVYAARHDLEASATGTSHKIINYIWTYATIGAMEGRANGYLKTLTAPIIAENGIIYMPLSYASDMFGWNVTKIADGIYAVAPGEINASAVNAVLGHIQ
ncbi:MAG: hypothetical protein IJD97_09885 [Clostridia bacterium]|nr:hypothetical protein [Clostridia bacterium]